MAAAFTIKIDNLDKLTSKFDRLANQSIEEVIQQGLDEAGSLVLPVLQANTPVDTGTLRGSMEVEKVGSIVYVGPSGDLIPHYAPDVEYGHHTRSGSFVEGQHFIERTSLEVADVVAVLFRNKIITLLLS